jgi:hypothetical protein
MCLIYKYDEIKPNTADQSIRIYKKVDSTADRNMVRPMNRPTNAIISHGHHSARPVSIVQEPDCCSCCDSQCDTRAHLHVFVTISVARLFLKGVADELHSNISSRGLEPLVDVPLHLDATYPVSFFLLAVRSSSSACTHTCAHSSISDDAGLGRTIYLCPTALPSVCTDTNSPPAMCYMSAKGMRPAFKSRMCPCMCSC